jgi:hypothetical protein
MLVSGIKAPQIEGTQHSEEKILDDTLTITLRSGL